MYNVVGSCQCGIDFEFLDSVLTERGILEDSISMNQFLRIKDVSYANDKRIIIFDCEVFEHILN